MSAPNCCPNRAENKAMRNTWPCLGHLGSITTNGGGRSHSLHRLALLWSNPAGLVRTGLGMGSLNQSARANADDHGFKGAAMLATLNSRQIVDEIVKDTMKDNDPHDAVQISPDVVRASRGSSEAPNLAPDIAGSAKPTIDVAPGVPRMAAPSVDTAIRVAAND